MDLLMFLVYDGDGVVIDRQVLMPTIMIVHVHYRLTASGILISAPF